MEKKQNSECFTNRTYEFTYMHLHMHAHIVELFEHIHLELALLKIVPLCGRGTPCIGYMDMRTNIGSPANI